MALGSGKKIEALEAEVATLKQWVAHLQGTDAVTLAAEVTSWRGQVADLQGQAAAAQQAAASARAEEVAARSQLADDLDAAGLQEAGFYVFNHPLDDAVAYKDSLAQARSRMKEMVRAGRAIESAVNWTVNNSAAQGRKMVKDISTLMLRAYNAEADALVRALRPHTLAGAKTRLDKSAMAIERLGKMMSIRISPDYHRLRYYELELTADYLVQKQMEKEAERERRAQLRDQQKAARELAAALSDLRKEQEHYQNLLAKLDQQADPDAYAKAQAKLAEIDDSINGVERRAANIRTGHVYVISNLGAFGPDMVKIGMTRRLDPYARVVELGDASVPFRFDVHAMVFHEDAVTLETHLHQALADRKVNRMNPRREFFYATPAEVRDILAKVAGAHLLEYRDQPEAPEWHQSGAIARNTQAAADTEADALEALTDATGEDLYADLDDDETIAPEVDQSVDELDAIEETALVDEPSSLEPNESQPHAEVQPGDSAPSQPQAPLTERTSVVPEIQPSEPIAAPTPQPAVVAPADWYPDPHQVKRLRYWDGQRWTEHTAD